MKSTIYISTDRIEFIGYEKGGKQPAIQEYASLPLREGSIMGGKITEPVQLVEGLKRAQEEYPQLVENPTLVIDGNFLLCKKLSVPKLKRTQYIKLIEEEFAEATEQPSELICDYHVLAHTGGDKLAILACAAEKATVESYLAVFQEAGIKLGKICLGLQAIMCSVEQTEMCLDKTFVINIMDGVSLLSLVFDKGVNVFMSRTRLYYENTDSLARALSQNLSGLMQFNRSQQLDEVEASYYMGLTEEELSVLQEYNPNYNVEIAAFLPDGGATGAHKLSPRTHLPYLALWLPDKGIDFLDIYKNFEKLKKAQTPKSRLPILYAGIVALLLIPILYLGVNNLTLGKEIQGMNDYLNDPINLEKAQELDNISAQTGYYNNVISQVKARETLLSIIPGLTSELLDSITRTNSSTIQISMLDFDKPTCTIKVSGRCANETYSAAYVEALKLNASIQSIRYTGYQLGDGENSQFLFTIELKLAAKAVAP